MTPTPRCVDCRMPLNGKEHATYESRCEYHFMIFGARLLAWLYGKPDEMFDGPFPQDRQRT